MGFPAIPAPLWYWYSFSHCRINRPFKIPVQHEVVTWNNSNNRQVQWKDNKANIKPYRQIQGTEKRGGGISIQISIWYANLYWVCLLSLLVLEPFFFHQSCCWHKSHPNRSWKPLMSGYLYIEDSDSSHLKWVSHIIAESIWHLISSTFIQTADYSYAAFMLLKFSLSVHYSLETLSL